MLQQLTIQTTAAVSLKPLLEAAIQNEIKVLALGLQRTRARLAEFEQQFNMPSAEFARRWAARELAESLDFIEWSGEIKTVQILADQQQALQGAEVL